ncbi:MAG TPA: TonB family protein [Terriglobales bacterium]|nr:TonB family protein [Terriglobales bacterium]
MLTRAFVLCSDEKALDAVSQILGELEIQFEQFHDIDFASKRLAAQAFDLVVVDCDRQDDAAELLASMRDSELNRGAMTVAVVNGKAGVPTAFRLGAELVISKPVSLEQARGTIRTAVAMRKKSHPEAKPSPVIIPARSEQAAAKAKALILSSQSPAKDHAAVQQPSGSAISSSGAHENRQDKVSVPAKQSSPISITPEAIHAGNSSKASANLGAHGKERSGGTATRSGHPPAVEAGAQTPVKRTTSPALLGALVLVLLAAGGYAAYTTVPSFQAVVNTDIRLIRSHLPGRSAPPVAAPKPAAPVQAAVKPAPVPVIPPDGFVAAYEDPATPETASAAKKPVLLATTATTSTLEEPAPITVADDLAEQHVATRVEPLYPEALRLKGVRGEVVLQAVVAKDGSVDSVSVLSGNPTLAARAMDAVKQWKYETYIHDGVPVGFQTKVTVRFEAPQKLTR